MNELYSANTSTTARTEAWVCNCLGPQNGEPRCPCMMRGVQNINGRWVLPPQDIGPVLEGYGGKK